MRKTSLVLLAAGLIWAGAFAQGRTVSVTGRAPISGGNTMGARQQALNNAFRMAVESGVGVLVESTTLVQNAMLISDRIYSKAQGYVRNYDITKEGAEHENYVVVISAEVSMADLTDDLRSIGVLQDIMGNPKIMSLIEEVVVDPGATAVLHEDASSSIAVEEKLTASSFDLVDREQVKKVRMEEIGRMGDHYMDSLIENPAGILRIARKAVENGAQYLLMGTCRIEPVAAGGGIYQTTATFKCKVVDAATAEKVAVTQKVEGGKGNNMASANMFAGQRAGESAAETIIPQIVQNWSKRANSGVQYIVKIYGITSYGQQGRKVMTNMKGIAGVTTCNKRMWDADMGRLELDIAYKGGSGDELIDGIFAAVENIPGFENFDLEEQTGNNLNFTLK